MADSRVLVCLWFDGKAREAAEFYTSLLPNSRITGDHGIVITFDLDGRSFMGLNGGPGRPHTEAASIYVGCPDQAEVDRLWAALTADGGAESRCGWLKDKYGVSWQIIPDALPRYVGGPDREAAGRATRAMLAMRKIDIAALEAAYNAK